MNNKTSVNLHGHKAFRRPRPPGIPAKHAQKNISAHTPGQSHTGESSSLYRAPQRNSATRRRSALDPLSRRSSSFIVPSSSLSANPRSSLPKNSPSAKCPRVLKFTIPYSYWHAHVLHRLHQRHAEGISLCQPGNEGEAYARCETLCDRAECKAMASRALLGKPAVAPDT
jgi:hypothetical protein